MVQLCQAHSNNCQTLDGHEAQLRNNASVQQQQQQQMMMYYTKTFRAVTGF
jgi:hypothetical protein